MSHENNDDELKAHLIAKTDNIELQNKDAKGKTPGKDHDHDHDLHKDHSHHNASNDKSLTLKRLYLVTGICFIFMIAEIILGYMASSIAIMSDAAHMLSDVLSFIISIASIKISQRDVNKVMSYGYHRAEVIGALASMALIWGLTIWLIYEATDRIIYPQEADGLLMIITGVLGFVFNIIMGLALSYYGIEHNFHIHEEGDDNDHDHDDGQDFLTSSAFTHVLGDALQNVGVLIAGGVILYNSEWIIADPICTYVFSIIIVYTTVNILKKAVKVLMEGSPANVKSEEVELALKSGIPEIEEVHDMHIWSLSDKNIILTCHIRALNHQKVLKAAMKLLKKKYGIKHATIQLEEGAMKTEDHHICDIEMHH